MRAVKIDPVSRTVTESELKKNHNSIQQEFYKIIGCDIIELMKNFSKNIKMAIIKIKKMAVKHLKAFVQNVN